jgi:hypothetical protein
MFKVTGKYKKDQYGFTTIYSSNTMYVIASKTGQWACVKVGGCLASGGILTQELYNKLENECEKTETFILK